MGSSLWSRKLPQSCSLSLHSVITPQHVYFIISAHAEAEVHFRRVAALCEAAGCRPSLLLFYSFTCVSAELLKKQSGCFTTQLVV